MVCLCESETGSEMQFGDLEVTWFVASRVTWEIADGGEETT